jgi:hypothetical protein
MALSEFQRNICRLLATHRILSGESYVAGGAALNEVLREPRLSRDLDLFHDTAAALAAAWASDRESLEGAGYSVSVIRERPTFVEAEVVRDSDAVTIQWTQDSAFRFFPLVEHTELGLMLHPFDLATNKVLAMVGRIEPRDWVDVIACDRDIQPLGYLAWAACGKDPGFSPVSILDQAARSGRYAPTELAGLAFDGPPPDAGALSQQWHAALSAAQEVVDRLPADKAGTAVLSREGGLYRGDVAALGGALAQRSIVFHEGSIRGAFPQIVSRA